MCLILNCCFERFLQPLMSHRYVIFDVETTGLYPHRGHRIIEIGAVAIDGQSVTGEFHTLINPGRKVHRSVQRINGITNEMLADQPSPEQAYPEFYQFIAGAVLVAHNAVFDVSFLRYEFGRLGMSINHRHICTLEMSRRCFPELPDHRLETVVRHVLGKMPSRVKLHRATADAKITAKIFMAMVKK